MGKYSIQYNGETEHDHGVFLYDYPEVSQAKKNYNTYTVPGRNGELISDNECLGNITISCVFSILGHNVKQTIRNIKKWLSGTGRLVLQDTPESFYEVLKIEYDSLERELRKYGRFTVVFICYPYEFMNDGQFAAEYLTYNPHDRCMPLYQVNGEGVCTITVNGHIMTANVGQNLTIDTRKQIAYREDGTMLNTAIKGDYEKLWLPHGGNEIKFTNGFQLKTIPRWGYDA